MINVQTISNVSDCVPLYLPHSLYLKPVAKLSISVGLPPNKMGKSISNFDIMDKLTKALSPDKFLILKVSKSTLEVIRLEAELEEPSRLQNALARLDGMSFKVNGFTEHFKVRAKECKDDFPNRHDWDTFFRDAHFMDEMKAGERPDTIHFANLPIRWFCPRHMENDDNAKPSESIFKRIFEKFGAVRAVDIPVCDAFRQKMSSDVNGIRVHNFEQDFFFEGYVQFEEYIGFVRAMDEFRGMKLVRKFVDKNQAVSIVVNFDKRKHLSDASIQRRERIRTSLLAKVKAKEVEEERKKKKEQEKIERERRVAEELKLKELERQREREEKRKQKHLKKLEEKGQLELTRKIRMEEKKLLIVRRKLESIRVLEALFDRLRLKDIQEKGKTVVEHPSIDLRQRLIDKYKSATEKLLDEQKRKLESEKLQTGLSGLLKTRKGENHSDDGSNHANTKKSSKRKKKTSNASSDSSPSSSEDEPVHKKPGESDEPFNPFKDVYSSEAAAELMKMSMLSYGVFPGMPVYRPPFPSTHAMRGFIPRGRGGAMRGSRRGGYNYHGASGYPPYYYNDYRNGGGMPSEYRERYGDGYKQSRSYSRSRSRKRSRTRSSSRSRSRCSSRSRSRTRSRRRRYSRSRRSRHRSNTRSSHSRSRSRSRTHSRHSRTRNHSRSRTQSRQRDTNPRNRSRSISKSKTSPLKTKSNRERSRSQSRARSRHRSRSHSRPRSKSKSQTNYSKADNKSRSPSRSRTKNSNRAHSTSKERDRHAKSKSDVKVKSKNHISEHTSKSHRTRSKSRSKSKLGTKKSSSSKKLVSTRRSRSQSTWSRSPSVPRRSWSRNADA